MPLRLTCSDQDDCPLPEAIEALAALDFDPRDEGSTFEATKWFVG